MSARSQTATSAENLLNSRILFSNSPVHLLTISSKDFPLNVEGGWMAIATVAAAGAAMELLGAEAEVNK